MSESDEWAAAITDLRALNDRYEQRLQEHANEQAAERERFFVSGEHN